jgi:hypothetical protein
VKVSEHSYGDIGGGGTPPLSFVTDWAANVVFYPSLIGGWWGYRQQRLEFAETGRTAEPQAGIEVHRS